jgi:hypothetical protein
MGHIIHQTFYPGARIVTGTHRPRDESSHAGMHIVQEQMFEDTLTLQQ